MTLLAQDNSWRTSWDLAVAGDWAPGGLLLYDRAAGTGAFYSVAANGSMTLLAQDNSWRTSWDLICSLPSPPPHHGEGPGGNGDGLGSPFDPNPPDDGGDHEKD